MYVCVGGGYVCVCVHAYMCVCVYERPTATCGKPPPVTAGQACVCVCVCVCVRVCVLLIPCNYLQGPQNETRRIRSPSAIHNGVIDMCVVAWGD